MLQRLCFGVARCMQEQQQQQQHHLLPLLQQLHQQHTLVLQPSSAAHSHSCNPCNSRTSTNSYCRGLSSLCAGAASRGSGLRSSATSSTTPQPSAAAAAASWTMHTQLAGMSQRPGKANPKEQKKAQKTDKKALKKSAVPQSSASASDSSTSFEDDMQTVEADVTRLVLQAIHNISPVLDVRTVRSATTVQYVPGLMPPGKARSVALHWLVKAADARKKNSKASYAECLALELLLAYQKRGAARQRRDDLHKLALQNRANVHMRWW